MEESRKALGLCAPLAALAALATSGCHLLFVDFELSGPDAGQAPVADAAADAEQVGPDAAADAAGRDLAAADTSLPDLAAADTSLPDLSLGDVSGVDAARPDSGAVDDAALPDTGLPDTWRPDTAPPDTSSPDIWWPDTASYDGPSCPPGFEAPPDCRPLPPTIVTAFPTPTGWTDENDDGIFMTFDAPAPNPLYYCRSGPLATVGGLTFQPCDGGMGGGAFHFPQPDEERTQGSYRTDVLVRVDGNPNNSRAVSYSYYVHESLNGAATCPALASADDYFAEASRYLNQDDTFGPSTQLANPFIVLDVTPSGFPRRIFFGPDWSWGPNDFLDYRLGAGPAERVADRIELLSLRKRFMLNPARTLVLIERTRISRTNPSTVGCMTSLDRWNPCVSQGTFPATVPEVIDGTTYYFRQIHCGHTRNISSPCHALVMNAQGNAVCLYVEANGDVWMRRLDPFFGNQALHSIYRHFSAKTGSLSEAQLDASLLYLPP